MKLRVFQPQRLFDNVLFHIDRSKRKTLQQFLLFIIFNHIAIMHSEFISGEIALALIALNSNVLAIVLQMHVVFFWCAEVFVAVGAPPSQLAIVLQMVFHLRIIEHHLLIGYVHISDANVLCLVIYLSVCLATV